MKQGHCGEKVTGARNFNSYLSGVIELSRKIHIHALEGDLTNSLNQQEPHTSDTVQ